MCINLIGYPLQPTKRFPMGQWWCKYKFNCLEQSRFVRNVVPMRPTPWFPGKCVFLLSINQFMIKLYFVKLRCQFWMDVPHCNKSLNLSIAAKETGPWANCASSLDVFVFSYMDFWKSDVWYDAVWNWIFVTSDLVDKWHVIQFCLTVVNVVMSLDI